MCNIGQINGQISYNHLYYTLIRQKLFWPGLVGLMATFSFFTKSYHVNVTHFCPRDPLKICKGKDDLYLFYFIFKKHPTLQLKSFRKIKMYLFFVYFYIGLEIQT